MAQRQLQRRAGPSDRDCEEPAGALQPDSCQCHDALDGGVRVRPGPRPATRLLESPTLSCMLRVRLAGPAGDRRQSMRVPLPRAAPDSKFKFDSPSPAVGAGDSESLVRMAPVRVTVTYQCVPPCPRRPVQVPRCTQESVGLEHNRGVCRGAVTADDPSLRPLTRRSWTERPEAAASVTGPIMAS